MSRWNDPAIVARTRMAWASVPMRQAVREAKHAEAIDRNSRTLHEHTRAHRLGRCECWLPERAQSRPMRRPERACPWPEKVAYGSPQEAAWSLGQHAKRRRGQGLRPYRCGAGHWHLGRLFDRVSAWARAA